MQLNALCRRIYSFYRVANAVILSTTMIAVVVLILLEGNRHVNLNRAVTEKIGDFLRLENSGSVSGADNYFSDTMSTARDVVVAFSVLYSAFMIITALVHTLFVFNSHNQDYLPYNSWREKSQTLLPRH